MAALKQLTHNDYTVGWICAVKVEHIAAIYMLEEQHAALPVQNASDNNNYTLGRIGQHNVVIAGLPINLYGTISAATVGKDLKASFPQLRFALMVGIAGGAPSPKNDIRLGDVVVSAPYGQYSGVVNYNYGKLIQDREFISTGSIDKPPTLLLTTVSTIEARSFIARATGEQTWTRHLDKFSLLGTKWICPGPQNDRLFEPQATHRKDGISCLICCEELPTVDRKEKSGPEAFTGLIGSSDNLIKDATVRDEISQKFGVLCFEMESAGLMDALPCLAIRGICDYADTHKNDDWREYAAATAASYAIELLNNIPSSILKEMPADGTSSDPGVGSSKTGERFESCFKASSKPIELTQLPIFEKRFVGRQTELENMEHALNTVDTSILVVHGMSGIGKTQLVRQFISRQYNNYKVLHWINASSTDNILADFRKAAHEARSRQILSGFDGPTDTPGVNDAFLVKSWLEDLEESWLMVLDSFDDIDDVDPRQMIPQSNKGKIVVTTVRKDLASSWGVPAISLESLPREQGVDLLLGRSSSVTGTKMTRYNTKAVDAAGVIVDGLEGIPLALEQAAALLRKGYSLNQLQKLAMADHSLLMSQKAPLMASSYEKNQSIATSFNALLQKFTKTNPVYMERLTLLSHLGATEVPIKLLDLSQHRSSDHRLNEWLEKHFCDSTETTLFLGQCGDFDITKNRLDTDGAIKSVSMHKTHMRAVHQKENRRDRRSWQMLAAELVAAHIAYIKIAGTLTFKKPLLDIAGAVQHCWNAIKQEQPITQCDSSERYVLENFGAYFRANAQPLEAVRALMAAVSCSVIQEGAQWPCSRDALNNLLELADVQKQLGHWLEAGKQYKEILNAEPRVKIPGYDALIERAQVGLKTVGELSKRHDVAVRRVRETDHNSSKPRIQVHDDTLPVTHDMTGILGDEDWSDGAVVDKFFSTTAMLNTKKQPDTGNEDWTLAVRSLLTLGCELGDHFTLKLEYSEVVRVLRICIAIVNFFITSPKFAWSRADALNPYLKDVCIIFLKASKELYLSTELPYEILDWILDTSASDNEDLLTLILEHVHIGKQSFNKVWTVIHDILMRDKQASRNYYKFLPHMLKNIAFLVREGFDPDRMDVNGHTALYHAFSQDHRECTRELMRQGANPYLKLRTQVCLNETLKLELSAQTYYERRPWAPIFDVLYITTARLGPITPRVKSELVLWRKSIAKDDLECDRLRINKNPTHFLADEPAADVKFERNEFRKRVEEEIKMEEKALGTDHQRTSSSGTEEASISSKGKNRVRDQVMSTVSGWIPRRSKRREPPPAYE